MAYYNSEVFTGDLIFTLDRSDTQATFWPEYHSGDRVVTVVPPKWSLTGTLWEDIIQRKYLKPTGEQTVSAVGWLETEWKVIIEIFNR